MYEYRTVNEIVPFVLELGLHILFTNGIMLFVCIGKLPSVNSFFALFNNLELNC